MEFMESFELVSGVGGVGLIMGLIQVFKQLGLPRKLAPVAAIALGLAFSLGFHLYGHHEVYESIIIGLAMGLTSVGAYSGTKNVKEHLVKK